MYGPFPALSPQPSLSRWCSRLESNQRPPPYQGGALPTELRERQIDRRRRTQDRAGIRATEDASHDLALSVFCPLFSAASLFSFRSSVLWHGAGDGNRTRTSSLEGYSSTVELLPRSVVWWWREVDDSGHPALRPSGQPSPVQNRSRRFCRTEFLTFGGSHPPPADSPVNQFVGGGRWIRTTEGMSQQIYSLPPLAAWVSLRNPVLCSASGL